MIKWIIVRTLLIAGLIVAGLSAPALAQATCVGGAALNGYYGMQVVGATPNATPKFLNGMVYFNGACALAGSVTIGENATVNSFANVSGSYTTNADNTITISLLLPGATTPETYDVGVTPVFNEALGVETDSSAAASIDLKTIGYRPTGPASYYNNASIKGTFVASCGGGAAIGYSDLNLFTFDGTLGTGNIVAGTDHYNNNAAFGQQTYIGYYGVNSIGTFGGYVVLSGGEIFGFSGVIDNNNNEIQFVYSTPNPGASDVVACTGKRIK